jgi:hypothetical protein
VADFVYQGGARVFRRVMGRLARIGCALAVVALALPSTVAFPADDAPSFFDPLVTISPGITREMDVLFDHVRSPSSRLTQPSLRLQYPVHPRLQFALEMPVVFLNRDGEPLRTAAGDVLLTGQAMAWSSSRRPWEIDLGLELTLPTGDPDILSGSTALRPFVAAGTKLGPFDVLGNLSYQWIVAGPLAETELLQTSVAVAYLTSSIAPFAELTLTKPVHGLADHRPQVTVLPGVEIFLSRSITLSIGVQLPLGPARSFDQRVLGFLKLPF